MTNKSKKFEDLGWAIVWRLYATMKHHQHNEFEHSKPNGRWIKSLFDKSRGLRREGRMSIYMWSEINIYYCVLQYSMKDSWFLWPLFCIRFWYESPVFDLLTIIDKLGFHMVQSKCIVGLDSCVFQRSLCVMKLWNILGHSSPPRMEH
jgi:hypothetical protein